ncbi:NADH-quinone oxidoreductase subunit L [Micromonospora polyrhachis]|uniref:NADH-quinone oxidoreductase subunit L n=1 Tax=Micromonospora polyrhachis TaxID=1282883 RepID=A0A7W7WPI5_9ACTN|nr:NADH-quinone oxidoreductase subunit L [Micromonospora polyrhachis]MBB4958278.1 NADH-quinone oxidoreductase subunit L [Micromonospora polyrhachis]
MSAVGVLGPLLPAVPFAAALGGLMLPAAPRSRSATGGGVRQPGVRRTAAGLGIGGAVVALVVSIALLATLDGPTETSTVWIDFGGLAVTFGVRLDAVAAMVAVAVSAVALAVQVYSISYLCRDAPAGQGDVDHRYAPYAAQISLFTAAMLLVVVSGDLIMLLVGWEVMGICSYLLIAHDRRLPEAPAAAMKAFLVTRVGDVGFLLGIAVLGIEAGSFRIADVLAHDYSRGTLTVACLLLLAGVAGKSAQFPLHTWLPDAMAGPTPVSALIHAATMVAAGIYAVTRVYPLFEQAPVALTVLGVMAVVTLLLGAFAATAQDDIKRVLAWSTVSQIGYMAGALAVGSPPAALFHLLSHAAFKALLFLAAGCVIHAIGSTLMSTMGGLRRTMPVTFWCTLIGLGALAGVPPLAGFWSKDGILVVAEEAARHGTGPTPVWLAWLVWLAGLLGVAVTAWYATRLLLLTFFGDTRSPAAHPHDPPPLMRWPVLLLAVPSALLGLAVFVPSFRSGLQLDEVHLNGFLLLPVALLLLGAGLAGWCWRRDPTGDPASTLGPLRPAFARAFWLDEVQHTLVVRPVRALARAVRWGDETVVDGVVEGTGRGAAGLGGWLGSLHRAGLPRAATAVLAGALLIGLAAVVLGGAG